MKFKKEGNKAQAYIIGLGINDINNLNSHPLGTIDDILTDNDSFYAWYYKLINLILTVNIDAKIFCNTLPRETTIVAQWNQAIREVVEYCHDTENKGVYCCDLASSKYMTSSFYKNPIFTNNYINGHYDAIGYQFMAECYMRVLSDVILDNYEEMRYVFQLPFDQPNKDVYERLLRGSTADRPTINDYYPPTAGPKVGASIYVGYCYFDTTIGKPIYWNGTTWVDSTSTTV